MKIVALVIAARPPTVRLPPTFKFPPIPTPPATIIAPVTVEIEAELLVKTNPAAVTVPVAKILVTLLILPPEPVIKKLVMPSAPPMYRLPATPIPPATTNAPVFVDVDCVVLDITNVVVVPVVPPLLLPAA